MRPEDLTARPDPPPAPPGRPERARLEERSDMLGRLLEMSPEGILVVQNGRVKECNHFLATRAGYAIDEIEGTCFASYFDRDSMPAVEALCGRTAMDPDGVSLPRAVLVSKHGEMIDVRLRAGGCRFGGAPAVLVALDVLDDQASGGSWGADLTCFLDSEETPFTLQRSI